MRPAIRAILASVIMVCSMIPSFGQNQALFTYGQDTVYKDEFIRVFMKNNHKEIQSDSAIKAYLQLYINFKLKVKEALALKMDTVPAFITELKGYRDQLARNYMVDTAVTQRLIDEAYNRMEMEVNASHIMVMLSPTALPKDTLEAYKKMQGLLKRIQNGEPFDSVAYHESEDRSARFNYGNLGYFTAFDMIYPFETMAYTSEIGSVSPIFRTQYGYHVLKVIDKRPYRGEIQVSHLMIKLNENAGEQEIMDAKRKADSIHSKLKSGSDWDEMVKMYSDDANTKDMGGKLDWISSNARLPEPFKAAAFALKNKDEFSEPVKTQYGWHIIRRIDWRPLKSKDELKEKIKNQISREPERSKINQAALVNRIKNQSGFKNNEVAYKAFVARIDSSVIKGTFKADQVTMPETDLFVIGDRHVSTADFALYLEQYQTPQPGMSIKTAVDGMYNDFVSQQVLAFEEDHLEDKYPNFRYLMQEYHDGILLFNLTEKTVWNKAIEDTTGLKEFYEQNKHRFTWKERVYVSIYDCPDKKCYKEVKKLLKKDSSDTRIMQMMNEKNPLNLSIRKSKYERGEDPFIDALEWKKGLQYFPDKNGKYMIVKVQDVLPAGPKALNEIKGMMTGEYQNMLEKQWIEELRSKYPVTVNEETLKTLFQ